MTVCGVCVPLDKKRASEWASKQISTSANWTNEWTQEEEKKLISYCSMCLVRYILCVCVCFFSSFVSFLLLLSTQVTFHFMLLAGCLSCHLFNLSVYISSSYTHFWALFRIYNRYKISEYSRIWYNTVVQCTDGTRLFWFNRICKFAWKDRVNKILLVGFFLSLSILLYYSL